jgi:hypothetical protein
VVKRGGTECDMTSALRRGVFFVADGASRFLRGHDEARAMRFNNNHLW